jgi:hypothetical protein
MTTGVAVATVGPIFKLRSAVHLCRIKIIIAVLLHTLQQPQYMQTFRLLYLP